MRTVPKPFLMAALPMWALPLAFCSVGCTDKGTSLGEQASDVDLAIKTAQTLSDGRDLPLVDPQAESTTPTASDFSPPISASGL